MESSNRVGRLYVALADTFADITEVPPGLSPIAVDLYQMNGPVFKEFVDRLRQGYLSTHPTAGRLVEGFKLTSLVLLDRMGIGLPWELDAETMAEIDELSTGMAWL